MAYLKTPADDEDEDQKQGTAVQTSSGEAQNADPLSGGSAPSGGASNPNTAFTQTNTATGKKILEKNADQGGQYDVTAPYQQKATQALGDISNAQAEHQKGIDTTLSSRKVSNDQINSAINGDSGSFQTVSNAIKNPAQFNQYKQTNAPDIQDVNALNTSVGLQSELAKQQNQAGNYNYNRGQSALDAALMGQSKEAQQKITDIQKKYGDVYAQRDQAAKEEAGKEEAARQQDVANQNQLKQYLQQQESGITDKGKQRAEELNRQNDLGLKGQYENYVQNYLNNLNVGDPTETTRTRDLLKNSVLGIGGGGVNPGADWQFNPENFFDSQTTLGDQYDPSQLGQYNNIASLLGQAPMPVSNAVRGRALNTGKLNSALEEAKSGNKPKIAQMTANDAARQAVLDDNARRDAERADRESERSGNRPGGVASKATTGIANADKAAANAQNNVISNWTGGVVPENAGGPTGFMYGARNAGSHDASGPVSNPFPNLTPSSSAKEKRKQILGF